MNYKNNIYVREIIRNNGSCTGFTPSQVKDFYPPELHPNNYPIPIQNGEGCNLEHSLMVIYLMMMILRIMMMLMQLLLLLLMMMMMIIRIMMMMVMMMYSADDDDNDDYDDFYNNDALDD